MNILPFLLGAFWGAIWAAFLQFTALGRYIAQVRTWLAVVIGVAGDLLICLLVLDFETWLIVCGVIVASALGIIARSLVNEYHDHQELMGVHRGNTDPARQ